MNEYHLGLGSEFGVRRIRKILAKNMAEAEELYKNLLIKQNLWDKKNYETIDEVTM